MHVKSKADTYLHHRRLVDSWAKIGSFESISAVFDKLLLFRPKSVNRFSGRCIQFFYSVFTLFPVAAYTFFVQWGDAAGHVSTRQSKILPCSRKIPALLNPLKQAYSGGKPALIFWVTCPDFFCRDRL
jgi:hypothetical protein